MHDNIIILITVMILKVFNEWSPFSRTVDEGAGAGGRTPVPDRFAVLAPQPECPAGGSSGGPGRGGGAWDLSEVVLERQELQLDSRVLIYTDGSLVKGC